MRAEKQRDADESIALEHARLENLRLNAVTENPNKCMSVASCQWTHVELQAWSEYVGSVFEGNASIKELQRRAFLCPDQLSQERFMELQTRSQLLVQQREPLSQTCMDVCRNREVFKDAVFVITRDSEEDEYFKFVTAFMRPFTLVVLPLTALDVEFPRGARLRADMDTSVAVEPTLVWSYDIQNTCVADVFAEVPLDNVQVIMPTTHKTQSMLVSYTTE
eukprot:6477967-Amphidinium_carterae.1